MAGAQDVPVRTADHAAGFTRIVFDFDDRPDWDIRSSAGRLDLVLVDRRRFDLSDVYRRIGTDRVRRIAQDGETRVAIELPCDCGHRTLELPAGGLVIDVFDGPPLPAETSPVPGSPDGRFTLAPRTVRSPYLLPVGNRLAAAVETGTGPALASLRDSLGSRIDPGAVPEPAARSPERDAMPQDGPPGSQIRISRPGGRSGAMPGLRLPASACDGVVLPPMGAWSDVADWRSALRVAAAGFDAGKDAALLDGVLKLLSVGFGAEAAALASGLARGHPARALLQEVAAVIDGDAAGDRIAGSTTCNPDLDLLAMLTDPPRLPADLSRTLRTFGSLTDEMASILGPRLAAAAFALGAPEEARLFQNARPREDMTPRDELLDVRLNDLDELSSRQALVSVAMSRTPEAVEGMTRLLDEYDRAGEVTTTELVDHAVALHFLSRGQPGKELSAAIARAQIARGDFRTAHDRIEAISRLDQDLSARLRSDLFRQLAGLESDAAFLKNALRLQDVATGDDAEQRRVAARLVALDTTRLARSFLVRDGEPSDADERVLLARISLSEGDLALAESFLTGLSGPEVDEILADIDGRRQAQTPMATDAATPEAPNDWAERVVDRSRTLREGLLDQLARTGSRENLSN